MSQRRRGEIFRDLHTTDGIFVMPNAWNAGSAVVLADGGFPALGTTSAGIAFGRGLPDYEGALGRATFGLIRRAADEMREKGTFTFAEGQVPDTELCRLFAAVRSRYRG